MNSSRPMRIQQSFDKWQRMKGYIIDLYKEQTLEQVIITLKDKHDFVVTKRQLVYRLSLWRCHKYSGPPTYGNKHNPKSSLERDVKDIADLDSSDESNGIVEAPINYCLDYTAAD
ncbi:uncharacterized protein BDZ83DRAFT_350892 [Colletotrichum acutatum]|uniref:Clr5 domain-containing protein n=1 Tax=Glomerella acutata TaxID=27357 RepID=A0AAD8UNV7_GLOAC|nr:uncharacterized protein BDZ83DRAFT_350892 [Colletotrichum acutatum]KAK1724509.1 hypothetical protein BDZ83DRAFT_350892 [Colletotrichum acutatum]